LVQPSLQLPTNITAEARARWAQARAAKDPKQKVKLLREFYSLMPHHKSTERLEVSIKKQISNLDDEILAAKSRKTGSTRIEWQVEKGIFPQVALSGPYEHTAPFFEQLTGLSTSLFEIHGGPVVGAYHLGGLTLQVMFTPYDHSIGRMVQERILYLIRTSDLLLINLPSKSWNEYWRDFGRWTLEHNLEVSPKQAAVELKNMPTGGIRLVGKSRGFSESELTSFLQGYNILNCIIKVSPDATLDDVEAVIFGRSFKKCVFLTPPGVQPIEGVPTASFEASGVFSSPSGFIDMLLLNMELVRINTRSASGTIAERPLLIRKNSKVIEVARDIHKDLWRNFRYAKVWRGHGKPPIRVGKDFKVINGDIIEIFD
jgi:ribosome-interacting GTPase 1